MRTGDFDYSLPPELIAQTPIEPRDSSRLMVLDRKTGSVEHRHFFDLADYLRAGDVLVFNDSRVIPARLRARKDTGATLEVLLLQRLRPGTWQSLVRPARRAPPGTVLRIGGRTPPQDVTAEVIEASEGGVRTLRFSDEAALSGLGDIPLPPYIHEPLADPNRYQTVYSRVDGSVAAPTAGLHFTPELLDKVRTIGVSAAFVTLHVGLDTFRPVREENPLEHRIHKEFGVIPSEAAAAIYRAKAEGRRVICVGTTSMRLVEAAARDRSWLVLPKDAQAGTPVPQEAGTPVPQEAGTPRIKYGASSVPREAERGFSGWVELFIVPGYEFKVADAMITNFHLPKTTLLMLVSAFAGLDRILGAYREAMAQRYRFYSFGDAMLIT